MKIRYKHQRFQAEATKCVSDVFQGQPKHDGSRTFLNKIGMLDFDGFGNLPLVLDNESLCENLRGIQMAEGLNLWNIWRATDVPSPLKWKRVRVRPIPISRPCTS